MSSQDDGSSEVVRSHVCTAPYHGEIQRAVDAVREHACNHDGEYDGVDYVVESGYYPDEWQHFVSLEDVPADRRNAASVWAISELVKRGCWVNSVRFDPPRLHVVRLARLTEKLPARYDHV